MKNGAGWPMGPCTLVDLVGIDVHVHASEALYEKTREPRMAPPPRLVRDAKRRACSGASPAAASTATTALRSRGPGRARVGLMSCSRLHFPYMNITLGTRGVPILGPDAEDLSSSLRCSRSPPRLPGRRAARARATGPLSVEDGRGKVTIKARGGVIGRLDRGSVTIYDLTPEDANDPVVFGDDQPVVSCSARPAIQATPAPACASASSAAATAS